MEYISRHMESRILEISKSYSAILLTGPRQAGKTTMLRTLAEKENIGRRYVTLDDLTERDMAKNDPALFLQLHRPPVLIDEVQYAPELFTYIKIYIDEHHNPGDFWMTGSQIFRLMRGVQESLAGRVALLHMSPMSQREIVGAPCVPFTTDMERLLAEREEQYAKVGLPHFKPWCICLTDGRPYPDRGWKEPARRFREKAERGGLTYLCVGVGDDISEETLEELSASEPGVIRLRELRFSAFFQWLSASMHEVSVAGTANQDNVRLRGIGGWARFLNPEERGGAR